MDNNGQVLTRMQIIDYVWKDSEETPYDRVIDVYIKEQKIFVWTFWEISLIFSFSLQFLSYISYSSYTV